MLWDNGTLVFGASDGVVYRLNAENGSVINKISAGEPIFTALAYDGEAYYAAGFTGNVYRINNL